MWNAREVSRTSLENAAIAGDSPLCEASFRPSSILSSSGHVEPRVNPAGPSAKAKYSLETDSEPVP